MSIIIWWLFASIGGAFLNYVLMQYTDDDKD